MIRPRIQPRESIAVLVLLATAAAVGCSLHRDGLASDDELDASLPGAGGASGAAGASGAGGTVVAEAGEDVSQDTSIEAEAEAPDAGDAPFEAESGPDVAIVDVVEADAPILKQPGDPCASASECASGFCDDAVCCSTSCAGPCRACDSQGTCEFAAAGTNVGTECGSCGACDGAGSCTCPGDQHCSTSLDPNDCSLQGQCAACADDSDCASGRCESCTCQPKLGNSVMCNEDSDCTSAHCNKGADVLDCAAAGSCQECGVDSDCASGRCEYCKCTPPQDPGHYCDEATDCATGRCGPTSGSDLNDCSGALCAECSDDFECPSGRCETCKCADRVSSGYCNEDSDCTSLMCGSLTDGDLKDCVMTAACVECRADDQCSSGRCELCKCAAPSSAGAACDEDTDCVSGTCSTYKCQ